MFQIAELLSTFAENLVVLSAVTQMSLPKYTGKKHLFFLWAASMIMMVPILILNQIEAFSFVTIIVGFVCAVALTRLLSKKGNIAEIHSCGNRLSYYSCYRLYLYCSLRVA